jgi:tetratricopeptide (TPR) repeat protein
MTPDRQHNLSFALRLLVLLSCLLAGGAGLLRGDVVYLKTGGTLRGEIIKQDDATITLRVPYGTMIIEKSHVKSVEKEDALKALLGDVDALIKNKEFDAAVEKLEGIVKQFPDSVTACEKLAGLYRRRAESLRERGRVLEADKAYRRVLELAPGDEEALSHTKEVDRIRGDAPAAEKEARLLISLERYQEALEIFDGLATFVPGSSEENRKYIAKAHAGYGRRLLEFKRFEEARSHYEQALKLEPALLSELKNEVVVARFSPIVMEINQKGKTLSEARWEALAAQVKALLVLDKDNPHLHYALGVCCQELQQYADAALEYARVTGEKPDLGKLPDALGPLQMSAKKKTEESPILLSFVHPRFTSVRPGPPQILETTHFIIHHNNDELALLVARGAEYYLQRNTRVLLDEMPEKPWPKKCHIYIYSTKEEYLKNSRQANWSPAMASTSAIGGVFESHHIMTYQTVDELLCSHLSHEIMHIVHSSIVLYSGGTPTWLREGLAVGQEPWFKRIRLARVIRETRQTGGLLELDQILNQQGYPEAEQVNLFYAQSYALVEAIQRAGSKQQFVQFCRQVINTKPLDAVNQIYGLSRDGLIASWKQHEADLTSLLDEP